MCVCVSVCLCVRAFLCVVRAGHEYSAYNPYKTSGKVIRVDDLPTEGLMITTPRGVPLKDCVNATRREMDDAVSGRCRRA